MRGQGRLQGGGGQRGCAAAAYARGLRERVLDREGSRLGLRLRLRPRGLGLLLLSSLYGHRQRRSEAVLVMRDVRLGARCCVSHTSSGRPRGCRRCRTWCGTAAESGELGEGGAGGWLSDVAIPRSLYQISCAGGAERTGRGGRAAGRSARTLDRAAG